MQENGYLDLVAQLIMYWLACDAKDTGFVSRLSTFRLRWKNMYHIFHCQPQFIYSIRCKGYGLILVFQHIYSFANNWSPNSDQCHICQVFLIADWMLLIKLHCGWQDPISTKASPNIHKIGHYLLFNHS